MLFLGKDDRREEILNPVLAQPLFVRCDGSVTAQCSVLCGCCGFVTSVQVAL